MKGILKRLFVKLPLYIIWIMFMCTAVLPIVYWLLTGRDGVDELHNFIDNI